MTTTIKNYNLFVCRVEIHGYPCSTTDGLEIIVEGGMVGFVIGRYEVYIIPRTSHYFFIN